MRPETIGELLESRDMLFAMVEHPSVGGTEKDDMLRAAKADPELSPIIETNRLLQAVANRLGHLVSPERPILDRVNEHMKLLSELYQLEDSFDPLTHFSDDVISLKPDDLQYDTIEEYASRLLQTTATEQLFKASYAAYQAESYRGFNVGCHGIYIDENNLKIGRLSTYNIKPHSLEPKICAEPWNLEKANEISMTKCIGLTIVSLKTQDDPTSRKPMKTQPPCEPCRDELVTNPRVTPSTVITAYNAAGCRDRYTVGQLVDAHGCSFEPR